MSIQVQVGTGFRTFDTLSAAKAFMASRGTAPKTVTPAPAPMPTQRGSYSANTGGWGSEDSGCCNRCSGLGVFKSYGSCFRCGGSGFAPSCTAAQRIVLRAQAKLAVQRATCLAQTCEAAGNYEDVSNHHQDTEVYDDDLRAESLAEAAACRDEADDYEAADEQRRNLIRPIAGDAFHGVLVRTRKVAYTKAGIRVA